MASLPPGVLSLLSLCLFFLVVKSAEAKLEFTTSYPRQCTPFNVTWTPTAAGYPYSVYIMAVGGTIQSFSVPFDYQPNSEQITFQFNMPPPSSLFPSFVVALADAQGNGNSSRVMSVDTNGKSSSNCDPWTASNAFSYAGDSEAGKTTDRVQCGPVKFYPVLQPFRGTRPFSITWVPLGGQPVSVSIPQSATRNTSYFIYNTPVPFPSGTQLYQFMSDAVGGGSGGGSTIYTVAPSTNDTCLASGYQLQDKATDRAMPEGITTATYRALTGAVSEADGSSSSSDDGGSSSGGGGGKNTGGLVGGIIGAVIGVGAISLLVVAFLIYRRRQKRQLEAARKEQPQFVDLDGDEDAGGDGVEPRAGRRGVSQTYHVSPFTYQSASPHSPDLATSEVLEMHHDSTQHLIDGNDLSPRPTSAHTAFSYNDGSYSQPRYPPAASSNHLAPSMSSSSAYQQRMGGETDYMSSAQSHTSQPHSGSNRLHGPYVLRARNDPGSTTTGGGGGGEAPPLPTKTPLFGDERDELPNDLNRRLLQHADAGPAANTNSSDVEELPPTYGQWTSPSHLEGARPTNRTDVTSEVTRAEDPASRSGTLW